MHFQNEIEVTTWGVFTPLLVLDTEIIWRIWILRILVPAASTLIFPEILHKVNGLEGQRLGVPGEAAATYGMYGGGGGGGRGSVGGGGGGP